MPANSSQCLLRDLCVFVFSCFFVHAFAFSPFRVFVRRRLHTAKEGGMPPIGEGSKVAIFGAGGPVGAAAGRALREHYTLRLTDLRPIAEIVAENKPQSPGAPLP